jgi:prepilin-type N-terminal cleavage/methylation domain-containing protein
VIAETQQEVVGRGKNMLKFSRSANFGGKSLILSGFQAYRSDKYKRRDKSAFTLAEVLITLGIIGVVAAMTIPTLMTKVKTARYRTAFKKGLSTLNQAVKMNYANYGWDFASLYSTNFECYKIGKGENHTPESDKTICAIMNGNLTGKTFLGNLQDDNNDYVTNLYSEIPGSSPAYYVLYQLADGIIVGLHTNQGYRSEETACNFNEIKNATSYSPCNGFIDVNGKAGPNRIITCADASANRYISTTLTNCTLEKDIGDVIPILFYDQTVVPATNAAMSLFNSK